MASLINARGAYTPLGVSRSPPQVAHAVAEALQGFVLVEDALANASREIAAMLKVEAATITHCTAASITLAVAATICGLDHAAMTKLPRIDGRRTALIQRSHLVDYGQPIEQAIRLCGANVDIVESSVENLRRSCERADTACLVLVESRLARENSLSIDMAIAVARAAGVPTILDAAAQTLRMEDALAHGADVTLFSVQKYFAGPTAGLVVGSRHLIDSVNLQTRGIGRGMKPTKESIAGVVAALRHAAALDCRKFRRLQQQRVRRLMRILQNEASIETSIVTDVPGSFLERLRIRFRHRGVKPVAPVIVDKLKKGDPPVFVFDERRESDEIMLELTDLQSPEIALLARRLLEVTQRSLLAR